MRNQPTAYGLRPGLQPTTYGLQPTGRPGEPRNGSRVATVQYGEVRGTAPADPATGGALYFGTNLLTGPSSFWRSLVR